MTNIDRAAVDLFKHKAELVSTKVLEKPDMAAVIDYALDLCQAKSPLQPMMENCGTEAGPVVAAPGLAEADFQSLAESGRDRGARVIKSGLRNHLAGIDLALTRADLAVASTATCILGCPNENERLATMVGEIHVMAVPKSKMVSDLYQAENKLRELLGEKAMYAAFISGCSRTSDIERVLTLGVHGPLELHVVLLDC